MAKLPRKATLQELRLAVGVTQVELARRSGVPQAEVSKAERRSGHRVTTLRRYVEQLGGSLEIWARFGSKRVLLRSV